MKELTKSQQKQALKLVKKYSSLLDNIFPVMMLDLMTGDMVKVKSSILAFTTLVHFKESGIIPNKKSKS